MSRPFLLSVLDQAPISEGSTGASALANATDLGRFVEELGYSRYWVAEHHGTPMLACTSPEVLISAVGGATSSLRVGSGGVMLPHYSPFKVAETFSMLSGLFPKRVDLAVGRAAGTDPLTAFALQRDRRQHAPDDFPHQLTELLAYLRDGLPAGHRFARLAATLPGRPERPDVWLLGSSPQSGIWAAELGLPYAFADFITPAGAPIAAQYRTDFVAAPGGPQAPRVIVAVWALCAETLERAELIAASSRMAFALFQQGELIAVPPIETALTFLERRPATEHVVRRRRAIVGDPPTVKSGIEAVAREYAADEVMIVSITYDHADRRKSYELIARAFE